MIQQHKSACLWHVRWFGFGDVSGPCLSVVTVGCGGLFMPPLSLKELQFSVPILDDALAHTRAALSEVDETASLVNGAKDIAENHVQLSSGVGYETQINGGQALAEGCDGMLAGLADVMKEVEGIALEAQMLQE